MLDHHDASDVITVRSCWRGDTSDMNENTKPPTRPEDHTEKQTMDEPQEEFVADQSVPSHSISEQPKAPAEMKTPTKRD